MPFTTFGWLLSHDWRSCIPEDTFVLGDRRAAYICQSTPHNATTYVGCAHSLTCLGQSLQPRASHMSSLDNTYGLHHNRVPWSSLSLVRPWSSIPPPQLTFQSNLLHANQARVRTYTRHAGAYMRAREAMEENRKMENMVFSFHPRKGRKYKKQVDSNELQGAEGMRSSKPWKSLESKRFENVNKTFRALEALGDDDNLPLLKNDPSLRMRKIRIVENKIKALEITKALEQASPPDKPTENLFSEFRARLNAEIPDGVSRRGSRAIWARNRRIAAAASKNSDILREEMYRWKTEIHELNRMVCTFKYHLTQLMEDGPNKNALRQEIKTARIQLDKEGAELAEENAQIEADRAELSERLQKRQEEQKSQKVRREEKFTEGTPETPSTDDGFLPRQQEDGRLELRTFLSRRDALMKSMQVTKDADKTWNGDHDRVLTQTSPKYHRLDLSGNRLDVAIGVSSGDVQNGLEDASKQEEQKSETEPAAQARWSQLREISQSISHLKDLAAVNQSDSIRQSAFAHIDEMLRELETEALSAVAAVPMPEQQSETSAKANLGGVSQARVPEKPSVAHSPEANEDSKPPRSLVSKLKAQLSSSNQIKIDDSLTVDVSSDIKSLQDQIFQLSQRLKKEYPMMDTLPYDVWKSEQQTTLQTWLKILVWKWQTRNEKEKESENESENEVVRSPHATPKVSLDVRAMLEQMVHDHHLDKKAAARMMKRWAQVFERKEQRAVGMTYENMKEETTEMFEWDDLGAGMGWLRPEGGSLEEETTKAKPEPQFPTNLPFRWVSKKGQGYRSGTAAGAHKHHEAVSKRLYSTSRYFDHTSKEITTTTPFRLEEASCSSEDPFSNGEIADLLAEVAKSVDEQVTSAPSRAKDNRGDRMSYDLKSPATPDANDVHGDTSLGSIPRSQPSLPHLTSSGTAHMVSVSGKAHTVRTAIATGTVHFSNPTPISLIHSAQNKKGDVLSVSRIAGIMAAKKTPDFVPLCHPIMLSHIGVNLHVFEEGFGGIVVESKVQCEGQTGVEMEALTSVIGSALSVVDMCKAIDKCIRIDGLRVVLKAGGRSGTWKEEGWKSLGDEQ